MRREGPSAAFTLIELLIVVAIIAILAMIAVPNFLEAQTRAKVSRSKTDQRSLHVAIVSLQVDKNVLLVDFWDDDWPQDRLRRRLEILGTPYQGHDNRGGVAGILVPLTTPIAYITSLPLDPFAKDDSVSSYVAGDPPLIPQDRLPPFTYFYFDNDPEDPGDDNGMNYYHVNSPEGRAMGIRPLREGFFVTMGLGPIRPGGYTSAGIPYDPTNGTASAGYIVRRSDSGDER